MPPQLTIILLTDLYANRKLRKTQMESIKIEITGLKRLSLSISLKASVPGLYSSQGGPNPKIYRTGGTISSTSKGMVKIIN